MVVSYNKSLTVTVNCLSHFAKNTKWAVFLTVPTGFTTPVMVLSTKITFTTLRWQPQIIDFP
jgi:hypothetical protein